MKYIIHSTIIFDTTEYLLTPLTDNNQSIKLSNSAGRILEELIKYQNTDEPITREYLFSTIWRQHGLEPSHGNLNQQISLIRKSLGSFGISPTSIITIPKRGLKLNKEISIEITDKKTSVIPSATISANNKRTFNKTPFFSSPAILKSNPRYAIILLILIITVLSISIIYMYIKDKNLKKLHLCKQINSCNICTFHQTPNLECNDLTFKNSENTQKNNEDYNKKYTEIQF
ncbi:winged helix-turn-helix domain-containing protein [Blochmannia endosymbiont of Polyrhachis (Hedomyrma) turneri]|uniref:winged helix-turn-helix domain-containing protein n=1 Tax=Blochmannia endosymbiont of Polyrhachis (Hedomyrma) turneri TaxID=1505596 RepID=UPI00061A70CF|nr:winged helix-turn-helix domain-containing protein [Blochmannia endosymbiont of Polyrhachis (Hedomyrma) turneri]AKC59954.1 Uncharacterized protein yqeI [Blochmannia endosymbiont of Polyrhachis (Hedomyrma) turneri]